MSASSFFLNQEKTEMKITLHTYISMPIKNKIKKECRGFKFFYFRFLRTLTPTTITSARATVTTRKPGIPVSVGVVVGVVSVVGIVTSTDSELERSLVPIVFSATIA